MVRHAYEEMMRFREEARSNELISDIQTVKNARDIKYIRNSRTASYFLEYLNLKKLDEEHERMFRYSYSDLKEMLYASKAVIIAPAGHADIMSRASEKYASQRGLWTNPFTQANGLLAGAHLVRIKALSKASDIAVLKARYESWGYTVYSLMEPTRAEIAERERLAAERALLRATALPTLGELIQSRVPVYGTAHPTKKGAMLYESKHLAHLLKNPEFKGEPMYLILARGKELPYNLNNFEEFKRLVKFVGTDIVCVSTKPEIQQVIKEGRKSVEDELIAIAKGFYSGYAMYEKLFYRGTTLLNRSIKNKYLTQKLFNRIPPRFTDREKEIHEGLNKLSGPFIGLSIYLHGGTTADMKKVPGRLAIANGGLKIDEHYDRVLNQYAENNFCHIQAVLEAAYKKRASPRRALARSILTTALKEPA
jgi:hypothetical protein